MDESTTVLAAAAIGAIAALGGTVVAEPLRAWARRREAERDGAVELGAAAMRLMVRVNSRTQMFSKPADWQTMLLAAFDEITAAQGTVMVAARLPVADRADELMTVVGELVDIGSQTPVPSEPFAAKVNELGIARLRLLASVRPWWRRRPTGMKKRLKGAAARAE